jgi:hypothetical protein
MFLAYIHIRIHTPAHAHTDTHIYIYIYIYLYLYMYMHMHMCIHVYIANLKEIYISIEKSVHARGVIGFFVCNEKLGQSAYTVSYSRRIERARQHAKITPMS